MSVSSVDEGLDVTVPTRECSDRAVIRQAVRTPTGRTALGNALAEMDRRGSLGGRRGLVPGSDLGNEARYTS